MRQLLTVRVALDGRRPLRNQPLSFVAGNHQDLAIHLLMCNSLLPAEGARRSGFRMYTRGDSALVDQCSSCVGTTELCRVGEATLSTRQAGSPPGAVLSSKMRGSQEPSEWLCVACLYHMWPHMGA